ncbi:MAG: class I SAM-dependent methyltransferase [Pseudobdellovibrionaceae bacterium]
MKFKDFPHFIFVEKPHGMSSHAATLNKWGLVEFLQHELHQKLFLFQRLDRDTSGCIVLAKSSEAAAELTEIWKSKQAEKTYWCLTDRSVSFSEKTVVSQITKKGNTFVSDSSAKDDLAETQFRVLAKNGNITLLEARPFTGKPHQIRLHAQDLGISLLGDKEHGGSAFHRLALHAKKLRFTFRDQDFDFDSKAPDWMENLELLSDETTCTWISALEKRLRLQSLEKNECLRLFHEEDPDFRMDLFGSQFWIYDYTLPEEKKKKLLEFCKSRVFENGFVRQMLNRGQNPGSSDLSVEGSPKSEWTAIENSISYVFKSEQGLSPGLFLDQRYNRQWVRENSKDKEVLNLFSYTGGFSVAAALGQANKVTTVDLSKGFLEWSKQNFSLNGLDSEKHEFWASDSFMFLQGCLKRQRIFDLAICDPPSFSRMKDRVFKIEKDFPELLDLCVRVLKPGGKLIFCTNFEKWSEKDLVQNAKKLFSKNKIQIETLRSTAFDYEGFDRESLMKTLLITR